MAHSQKTSEIHPGGLLVDLLQRQNPSHVQSGMPKHDLHCCRHKAPIFWVFIVLATYLVASPAWAQVEVRHLGNEGFLISAGEKKVLIDALFGDGLSGYPAVPKVLRKEIEAAEGDFAGVDLVLASHFHGDHFDAAAVARHLEANPRSHFVSTLQAAEKLRAQGVDSTRMTGFWPKTEEQEVYQRDGLSVTALRFHHGNSPAQNLGLLIHIGGLDIIHLGDTAITPDEIGSLPLDEVSIDVALVPYWYFDSKSLHPVLDLLNAKHLVAMHFPATDAPANYFGEAGDLEGQIKASQAGAPQAWMAYRSDETRTYSPR